eukprot:1294787-Amphidinium_carterae.2
MSTSSNGSNAAAERGSVAAIPRFSGRSPAQSAEDSNNHKGQRGADGGETWESLVWGDELQLNTATLPLGPSAQPESH